MLNKVITSLTPNYNKLSESFIFLILFGVSIFIRLPFFFRDYVDRDESTFILIGQSWVEGHLPYMELWDVKPPLTFLFFAVIIYIFGKSFLMIRLVGALFVAVTAFFTYKSTALISDKRNGFWAAVFCIILLSLFGSIQGVMSEHICMAFFMISIFLLLKFRTLWGMLVAGLLMGMTLMTKLNLAYAILLIGLFLLYDFWRQKSYWKGVLHTTAFGTGILFIVFLTLLPYYLEGQLELWWKSVFIAPLDYAGARRYSPLRLAPFCLIILGFLIWGWKTKLLDFKDSAIQLLTLAILGVVWSFVRGGRINSHYLIQLFPLMVILVVIVVSKLSIFRKFDYRPFALFLLLLIPMESYLEYVNIAKNKIQRGTWYNGEGFTVPKYITEQNLDTENVLFLGYHIGYWVLGETPPTKAATHPSNLCKDEMFAAYDNPRKSSMEELRYIMEELRPKTIVARRNRLIFDKDEVEENSYMEAYLDKYYSVLSVVDNAEIYQRLE
ncbi:MAG: ArnT family glycosyltransferase [Flavobacteriaceae bacterium]